MTIQALVQTHAKAKPAITHIASSLLQRTCACGQHTGSGGECEECKKKRQGVLQRAEINNSPFHGRVIHTKLAINKPGDEYEQEAERIANQVMSASAHDPVRGGQPRIQRFPRQSVGRTEIAPASVDYALASPGMPLQQALRHDMEQRFGYDFSQVRIHADAASHRSARNVNAHAYTVGQDIVFGAGWFAPETYEGRRLIAHELTHVVQQSNQAAVIQRFVPCTHARLSLEECPHRETNEDTISLSDPSIVVYITSPEVGFLITNFDIGKSNLKAKAKRDPSWSKMIQMVSQAGSEWELVGLSDCHGTDQLNKSLRQKRADSVRAALPPIAAAHIVGSRGASLYDCITDNENLTAREWNRSVLITRTKSEQIFQPDDPIEGKIPLETPDTEDCDKKQRDALSSAFPLAKKMVRAALRVIDDAYLMKKYFGKDALAHRFHIKQNFVAIKDGLDSGPTFQCEEADSWWCHGAVARTLPVVGLNIHICPSAIARGVDYLARTIVHESGHMYALIFVPDDLCEGGWPSSRDTTDAEDNADCYGEFAGDALAQQP